MTPESNFYIFWTNTVWLKGFSLSPTQPNQTLKNFFLVFLGLGKDFNFANKTHTALKGTSSPAATTEFHCPLCQGAPVQVCI